MLEINIVKFSQDFVFCVFGPDCNTTKRPVLFSDFLQNIGPVQHPNIYYMCWLLSFEADSVCGYNV